MPFLLETFGGLRLLGADGQPLQAQRRRLALLALLAAGERGMTRDRLVADLWPETAEERARHALNQLLYGIRQSLSDGAIRGVDSLALDPAVVDSDVRRFEVALSSGDMRGAVAQYKGPFLDAFYLPDAPEFERRVEEVRVRLAALYVDALERLATDAERRGNTAELVAWRRTLAELDRLDARRAIALMRALEAAGDSAGALSHARAYETLVREELDTPADPAVLALASEIRASVAARASALSSKTLASREPPASDWRSNVDANGAVAGDVATDTVEPSLAARPRRSNRAIAIGVAALALAAVSLGVREVTSHRAPAASTATSAVSIAVLPLANLSAASSDAAIADGMTEALITVLSRGNALRVAPKSWVYALEDRHLDARQIAESLRVAYVLEGGIQTEGRRLRMRLRLVDVQDGSTRWSETYDRQMGDIFALQDDISRSVTRELGVRLGARVRRDPGARRHVPSIQAYEWYLRAQGMSLGRSPGAEQQAREYFGRAIAADSTYVDAYAGLAFAYTMQAGEAPGNQRESFARAAWAARRAIALDDSSAEANVALGWALQSNQDWKNAEIALKRGVSLDPQAPRVHEALARHYLWTGRPAEQLAEARLGLEADPFSISAVRELALALAMNGQCDETLALLAPLKTLSPPARLAGVIRGQCYAAKKMWPEAIAEFRWAKEGGDAKTALAFLGYALARGGQEDEASRILSDLLAGRQYSHGAFGIAAVYAGLGNYDEAFAWLRKAVDEQSVRPYIMGPMFDDVRRDPRFADVKRGLRL